MNKCCRTVVIVVCLTAPFATQSYIYNHAPCPSCTEPDKVALSILGAFFWLPYWLGVGAHAIDRAITSDERSSL